MPVRRGVFTLKETCLRNVAQNMDSVWCEDYVKNFLDQGQYLHIVGPFEYLRKFNMFYICCVHGVQGRLEYLRKLAIS